MPFSLMLSSFKYIMFSIWMCWLECHVILLVKTMLKFYHIVFPLLSSLFYFFDVYLFILRERESRGGTEREGDKESQSGSALPMQSPMWGSNSQSLRSWPEPKSRVRWLTDWATKVALTSGFFTMGWEPKRHDKYKILLKFYDFS